MIRIDRETACALAGMHIEAFKTLGRRRQLPTLPPSLPPFPRDRSRFTPLEMLSLAIYEAAANDWGVNRYQAATICTAGADLLLERWCDIRDSSEWLDRDILFGRVLTFGPRLAPACGTFYEIVRDFPKAISILLISATRVAITIQNRAADLKIDLTEFWTEPFPLAPQLEPSAWAAATRMAKPQSTKS
jgi:hypothetical protein